MRSAYDLFHTLVLSIFLSQIVALQVDQRSTEQTLDANIRDQKENVNDSVTLTPDISDASAGTASRGEQGFTEHITNGRYTQNIHTVEETTENTDTTRVETGASGASSNSRYQKTQTTVPHSITDITAENEEVTETSVIAHFITAIPGTTGMPNNVFATETDHEPSSVTGVSFPPQQTTPSTYGHFHFSTDDYVQCFRSPLSDYFSSGLYANVTGLNGTIEFTAEQAERQKERMCIVGITVPSDMIIVFQLVNINLKCGWASFRVFKFATARMRKVQYTYCGTTAEGVPKKIYILSSEASVILNIWLFSWEYNIQVNFTAIPYSLRPKLLLTHTSDNLGK